MFLCVVLCYIVLFYPLTHRLELQRFVLEVLQGLVVQTLVVAAVGRAHLRHDQAHTAETKAVTELDGER